MESSTTSPLLAPARRWAEQAPDIEALYQTGGVKQFVTPLRTPGLIAAFAGFDPDTFDETAATQLRLEQLGEIVLGFASIHLGESNEKALPAEYWGCRYLGEDRTSLQSFFSGVRHSALAEASVSGMRLALAAGAWAWVKLREHLGYTAEGSLADSLHRMDPTQVAEWRRTTASYYSHSCSIEGVDIPSSVIEKQLERALR